HNAHSQPQGGVPTQPYGVHNAHSQPQGGVPPQQYGDHKAQPQPQGGFPRAPQPAHVNANVNQPPMESSSFSERERRERERKAHEKAIRKQFPYRIPTPFKRKKCIAITVFKFLTLVTTLSVLELYVTATYVTHDLPRKLFFIIVACEFLPRIIQTYQVYIYTKKKLTLNDAIGTLLCQINYYYWMGKQRGDLTKSEINKIEFSSDLISLTKLFVLAYIYSLQSDKLQQSSGTGKKVASDM
ncbi:2691_t:CDS:2, partial [Racocetra persica]